MFGYVRLFYISFLLLFFELLLVRWVGEEIRIFAYLSNFTLLAVFLGASLGTFKSKERPSFLPALLGVLVLSLFFLIWKGVNWPTRALVDITELVAPLTREHHFWGAHTLTPNLLGALWGVFLIFILFLVLVLITYPIGQLLGWTLVNASESLPAYSVNLIAGLLGIWVFSLTSFFWLPLPLIMIIAQVMLIPLLKGWRQNVLGWLTILVICLTFLAEGPFPLTIWSPYQKLTLGPLKLGQEPAGFEVDVNGVYFMRALDLSEEFVNQRPQIFLPDGIIAQKLDLYNLPYHFKPKPAAVLIVGAGSGNDVAAAIRAGSQRVTAVEIDPAIAEIGRRFHPEKPYQDQRVKIVIDDGRSFFKKTPDQFDLIIFSLADSHTLGSHLNDIRLDSYLYTREGLTEAWGKLTDDGVLVLSFLPLRDWIANRLYVTLAQVSQTEPLALQTRTAIKGAYGFGGTVYVVSKNKKLIDDALRTDQVLEGFLRKSQVHPSGQVIPATDNWPYLYLDEPRLPQLHLVMAVILVSLLVWWRRLVFPKNQRLDKPMFFLGAAFLLLEFTSINRLMLLFGTTWLVNSIAISGVLLLGLLANLVVSRYQPKRIIWFFGPLFLSCLVVLGLPLSELNRLPFLPKVVVSGVVLNLPLFFSGLVFSRLFATTRRRDQAFASNILGAALGGILAFFSFRFGIQALLIFVFAFYVLAFLEVKLHHA